MRFHRKTLLIITTAFLIAPSAFSVFMYREWQIFQERYFLREVLLYAEYGDRTNKIARWAHSPRIVFASDLKGGQAIFNDVVGELNGVLEGTGYRLITNFDSAERSHIFVFVVKPERFSEISGIMGCGETEFAVGYGCSVSGEDWSFEEAIVLVSAEQAPEEIRSTLLKEIFQTLGPTNDSAVYRDSQNEFLKAYDLYWDKMEVR